MKFSVIMSALNEPHVEQTIRNVIDNSGDLLGEIIVIDDGNDVPLRFSQGIVSVIRNEHRQGLIRSRNLGFRAARHPLILSIDPHCKVSPDWLRPIHDVLCDDYRKVVIPATRGLNIDTWKESDHLDYKTSWTWNLDFYWRHDDKTNVSPAFAGHCFATTKRWFDYLGGLDDGMYKWGGENIEFSLMTWLCGGSVEVVRDCWVAHWFKRGWSYEMDGGTLLRNKTRIVETWFDDYADRFYDAIGRKRGSIEYGDISQRLAVKRKCQIRDIRWFIDHLQPELAGVCDLRNAHKGKHIAILGGSKAVDYIDPEYVSKYDVIIGVNYISLHRKCDYVIFHDLKPANAVLESGQYDPKQLLVPIKLKDGPRNHLSETSKGWRIFHMGAQDQQKSLKSKHPPFFHHATTAHTAAHIAAYMGAKSVTMIGCDACFSGGTSHVDIPQYRGGKYWGSDDNSTKYLERMNRGYDMLREAFEKWNIPLLRYGLL